jgi:hypothetical protein
MPPYQTTFLARQPIGVKGRRVNMEEWNAITCLPDTTNVKIAMPVAMGTGGAESIVPYTGTGRFRGITEIDQTIQYGTDDTYPEGYNVPVMTSGVIWATAAAAVTAGQPVFYVTATDNYHNTAAAGRVAVPGAEFDSSAASGELVKIRLRDAIGLAALDGRVTALENA